MKAWNLILIKKISETASRLEIYIAVEQKINGVESQKYSLVHFLLFFRLQFSLLVPGNFVISVCTFSSSYMIFTLKNGNCFSLYFSSVINNPIPSKTGVCLKYKTSWLYLLPTPIREPCSQEDRELSTSAL